jgi:type 1 glutamine amidotransferase
MARFVCHDAAANAMKNNYLQDRYSRAFHSCAKISTLVLCGDAWHPAEVVQHGLNALADSRFAFEFVTQGGDWSPALMTDFQVVIVAKANHLSAADQRPWLATESQPLIRTFVRAGGGLLIVHGGTCYKDFPEMRSVTGGAFMEHPDQCLVSVEPKAGHPLAAGVSAFTEKDEHYFMALDAFDADVFMKTRSEHGVQPGGWTRTEGNGRVCVITPGHNVEVWSHPAFQQLLRNGLIWVAGE